MILKARYCILEQIGKGGEGHMYLARDLELGVLWAVKELPRKKKSEAKLLRLLDHPALPKMIDYVEKEEFCYLVMEYIRGKSLSKWLQEGKCFHVQELLEIGIRIAQVLEYLHALHPPVFYGDLKPENLMYTERGEVYLVDFGSAVFAYDGIGKAKTGTHGFAAPEQYEGKIQEGSDVFGFGKTMLALAAQTQKKEWIKYVSFLWILLRCSLRTQSLRYLSIEQVRKKLQECYVGRKRKAGIKISVLFFFILVSVWSLKWMTGNDQSFACAVGDVMAVCYEDAFLQGSKETRQKILEETGEGLRKLLQKNGEKEEERKLFLMLALNEELRGEEKGAALQYEQLLFYDRVYRVGYGEYGCFLLRAGQTRAAEKLWENYEKLEQEGILEKRYSRNQKNWQAEMGKETSVILPDKKGMSMDVGGFNLSVDTEETDGWWNQGEVWEGENEKEETNSGNTESIGSGENITGSGNITGYENANGGNTVSSGNTENNKDTASSANTQKKENIENNKNTQGSASIENSGTTANNGSTAGSINVGSSGTAANNGTTTNSGKVQNPIKSKVQPKKANATATPKITQKENITKQKMQSQDEEKKNTKQEEQQKRVEENFSAIYFSNGEFPAMKSVQVQKKTLEINIEENTEEKKEIRFRMDADFPVHIWSVRIGEKECLWHYTNGHICVQIPEADESTEQLELLLVYEEKRKEPILTIT